MIIKPLCQKHLREHLILVEKKRKNKKIKMMKVIVVKILIVMMKDKKIKNILRF